MLGANCHIWIIVGYTGVGKTTQLNMLIERTNLKALSFNSIAKRFCQRAGYKGVRDYFGSVSESQFINTINDYVLIEINSMIASSSHFIIEGLPSISIIEKLRSYEGISTTVIYLEASTEVRKSRMKQRADNTCKDVEYEELSKNQFKEALGLVHVIASADHNVDAAKNPDAILVDLLSIIFSQAIGGIVLYE